MRNIGNGGGKSADRRGESPALRCVSRHVNAQTERIWSAVTEFKLLTGYPKERPRYVVVHIVPVALCAADTPENMQWQTIEAAKAKDRWNWHQIRDARSLAILSV